MMNKKRVGLKAQHVLFVKGLKDYINTKQL